MEDSLVYEILNINQLNIFNPSQRLSEIKFKNISSIVMSNIIEGFHILYDAI